MPNDTYEDHRLTCTAEFEGSGMDSGVGANRGDINDSVDASDYLDMDNASALVINTDDNDEGDNVDTVEVPEEDIKNKSNTSKNKLESLLGRF